MCSIIFHKPLNFSFFLIITFLLSIISFPSLSFAESDDGFPGRKLYPQVKTISKEALYKKIKNDDVMVVDVRSDFEYQTLKISGAVHIPNASKSFPEKLKALRDETAKDIVFYCNGRSCFKSYNAAMKAIKYNVSNCYSYDAGVFEWALMYPDNAELLGRSPVDEDRIISKQDFTSHQLSPKDFEQQSLEDDAKIYDVRDREQRRGGSGLFMFRDKSVQLDNTRKLARIVSKAIDNDSTLYFYDQKGKQVRWLQYFLESEGLENYFFMKGGAAAYHEMITKEQGL